MSGTFLKFLALVCMTVDHVGMVFFPGQIIFRQIGRLAFPIFAYMIAEGCYHTHRMGSYLGKMVLAGAVCQAVYYFFMDSLYQSVLVTFSLAIALIWLLKKAREGSSGLWYVLSLCGIAAVYFVTERLASYLPGTDYAVDYGFFGVMLPVAVYLGRTKGEKLTLAAILLLALAMVTGTVQFYALLTLPLLALYNGKRGKGLGKYFFYIYYPLHLVVIQIVAYFI